MKQKANIPHDIIFCRQLSLMARGILAYAIAHEQPITEALIRGYPNGVKTSIGHRPVGRDLAKSLINEIVAAGFASYVPGGAVYLKERIREELREEVFARDGRRCVECGSSKRLSVDHIIPESRGGRATLANLRTLCKPCNSEKGDRLEVLQ